MDSWLKCKVEKGMFPDERTVSVQTDTGMVAVFCHQDFLLDDTAVRVLVLRTDGDKSLVRLPAESPAGQLFWVSRLNLAEAAVR